MTKVAIITEGVSEYRSLPKLYRQLAERTGNSLLHPTRVSVSPDASPEIIARNCSTHIKLAMAQRAELVVVLLDREVQAAPAGDLAAAIELALRRCTPVNIDIYVVLKDRMYENWLISDLEALRSQPGRFKVTAALVRAVEPNKADTCNAMALIKRATIGDSYDKVPDSVRICQRLDVGRASKHSRSIRHFLHVLGDPVFEGECKRPPSG